jgi:hypothetical protein
MAETAFNSGKFMEKVSALAIYDSVILQDLYKNPINKQKINRGAAFLIKNYFDQYLDSKSRQDKDSYHHVYEFDKTGDSGSRLFKAVVVNTGDGAAVINYSFTAAKEPNREGYPFPNKADVMESGETVKILPKRGKYLRYVSKNGTFVTSEMSVIPNPGGDFVKGSFQTTFNRFMGSQASFVLSRARYFETIEQSIIQERRLAIPRINKGMTADAAKRAQISAARITSRVVATYA